MSKNFVFLGAPGAGKGTQSKLLENEMQIPQISTGDMLREATHARSALGVEAEKYMSTGQLLPDHLVIQLIKERLNKDDCQEGFILDGFPRTIEQAEALDELLHGMGKHVDLALSIVVDENTLLKRLSGRRTCAKCGAGYHIEYAAPKLKGICDKCGTTLIQREDDKEETILKRLKVYHDQTQPVLNYYNSQGKIAKINGEASVDKIFEKIKSVI